jgi:transcriptional regulator with XRE-family HTH domain
LPFQAHIRNPVKKMATKIETPTRSADDDGVTALLERVRPEKAENLLSHKVRRLRREAQLTLQELSDRSGISPSALSKIEKAQLSPTYEKIAALAKGLGVQVGELFNNDAPAAPTGRRTLTRRGAGVMHETPQYNYEVLCADLAHKQFVPLLTTIKARTVKAFPSLLHHEGEEFIYVLRGKLTVHTDFYQPMELGVGDSCYFDSTMGHACVAAEEDAQILWVCSNVNLPG